MYSKKDLFEIQNKIERNLRYLNAYKQLIRVLHLLSLLANLSLVHYLRKILFANNITMNRISFLHSLLQDCSSVDFRAISFCKKEVDMSSVVHLS